MVITHEEMKNRSKEIKDDDLDKDITINMRDLYSLIDLTLEKSINENYNWWKEKGAMYINDEWHFFEEHRNSGLTQLDFCKEAMDCIHSTSFLEFFWNLKRNVKTLNKMEKDK
jgi:hypothetical protein